MPNTVKKEREELEELLRRQAKEQQAKERHKKHSARYRQAVARLHRLKPLVRASRKELEELERRGLKLGPDAAVAFALSQVGVTERPMNSNWGRPVEDWIKRTGYGSPVPWCGCFVHEAVVEIGKAKIPREIRLGYTGYIEDDAQGHVNGLKEVPWGEARKGDIVCFTFSHIALVRGRPSMSEIPTVEGNTSPVSSGSQSNGGCVAAKTRRRGDVTVIARPAWRKE